MNLFTSHNSLSLADRLTNTWLGIRYQILARLGKTTNQSSEQKKGMELTFLDEFTQVSWLGNNRKWIVGEHWGLFHPEKPNQYYGEPSLAWNTCAKFTAEHRPTKFVKDSRVYEIPFRVSLLSTAKTFRQQYGRFECRMTLPKGIGTWPAFWLWWAKDSNYSEIDVIEGYGRDTGKITEQEINLHWRNSSDATTNMKAWTVKLRHGVFYEFAAEWRPGSITFFTDGVPVFRFTNKSVLDKWFNQPNTSMWMVLNHGIKNKGSEGESQHISRGEYAGYSSSFLVDYVRAYQFTNL